MEERHIKGRAFEREKGNDAKKKSKNENVHVRNGRN